MATSSKQTGSNIEDAFAETDEDILLSLNYAFPQRGRSEKNETDCSVMNRRRSVCEKRAEAIFKRFV
ncbi:hypothetical protein GGER_16560 [Serratia rubidaea]